MMEKFENHLRHAKFAHFETWTNPNLPKPLYQVSKLRAFVADLHP